MGAAWLRGTPQAADESANHQPDPGDGTSLATQRAAVLAVVIASVIVSFAAPGPYSWASTLIGLILLLILVAYGGPWPRGVRDTAGYCAALAFTLVLTFSLGMEVIAKHWGYKYGVSGWDIKQSAGSATFKQSDGLGTAVAWAFFFVITFFPLLANGRCLEKHNQLLWVWLWNRARYAVISPRGARVVHAQGDGATPTEADISSASAEDTDPEGCATAPPQRAAPGRASGEDRGHGHA